MKFIVCLAAVFSILGTSSLSMAYGSKYEKKSGPIHRTQTCRNIEDGDSEWDCKYIRGSYTCPKGSYRPCARRMGEDTAVGANCCKKIPRKNKAEAPSEQPAYDASTNTNGKRGVASEKENP